jgi:hypothetical protein
MPLRSTRKPVTWEHVSDEDLLDVRIADLKVRIKGTDLERRIAQLYGELEARGLKLRPKCFLSDEWLSPGDQAAIGVPFFLAHPRLKALENRMMFEVEGGTPRWCLKLLRHEAGHAYDHAYHLSSRADWKDVFGSPRRRYEPYFYENDPASREFVQNLPDHYAQAHPVEDFAESFAVWLDPASNWREKYKGTPAARKLRYVERLMREVRARRVPRRRPVLGPEARTLQSTLRRYYERKFRLYKLGDLSFAVRDMKRIFRASRAAQPQDLASEFIRAHKRRIVDSIASWSGERRGQVARVVASLAQLADQHSLVVRAEPDEALVRFSTFTTTLIVSKLLKHTYRATRP